MSMHGVGGMVTFKNPFPPFLSSPFYAKLTIMTKEKPDEEKQQGRKHTIEDWEQYYVEERVEEMPWFHERLDDDFETALCSLAVTRGRALDLGTGPGTQATALAERGFTVTATDISATAVRDAAKRAKDKGLSIKFIQDDIRNSRLEGPFDVVLDRGCFHTIPPEARPRYIDTTSALLKPGGHLLLKCFSHKETMEGGPHRFTPEDLKRYFAVNFEVLSIIETVFHGTLSHFPKALFAVMQRTL